MTNSLNFSLSDHDFISSSYLNDGFLGNLSLVDLLHFVSLFSSDILICSFQAYTISAKRSVVRRTKTTFVCQLYLLSFSFENLPLESLVECLGGYLGYTEF